MSCCRNQQWHKGWPGSSLAHSAQPVTCCHIGEEGMAGHGRKNKDEQLLLTLACGATVEAAARAVGLSEATVYRRRRDPAFRQRLKELRADFLDRTSAMLTAAGGEFVKTLLALVKEPIPPAVRLGAARAGLEIDRKFREE